MTSHVSRFGTEDRRFAGSAGRSLEDVIDDINRFTAQNPGELIFVDLSHEIKSSQEFAGIRDLDEHEWTDLYNKLSRIEHLWNPSDDLFNNLPHDLSTVPVLTFIQPGLVSAVIVRVPGRAPQTSLKAVIHNGRIPYGGRWSDTMDAGFLEQDQVKRLQESRPSRDSEMHRSTYTITQSGTAISNVGQPEQSIIGLSKYAHKKLFLELWPHLSGNTYPNIIEIDNMHNSNVAAMCIVINEHFAK